MRKIKEISKTSIQVVWLQILDSRFSLPSVDHISRNARKEPHGEAEQQAYYYNYVMI